MNGTSYLLAIDGSEESRAAAYFAWDLASETGSRVVAQHVVDTEGVWRFLSYDLAGFVGSGVYMEARERINEAMNSIGEAIMLSYGSQVGGRSLQFETCIDEGDPATEIARRAQQHDLVILGFHSRKNSLPRARMFERLAETCPSPLLVVRNTRKPWTAMQVCLSNDISDENSISRIYQLGAFLGLPIDVFVDNSTKRLESARLTLGGWSPAFGVRSIERGNFKEVAASASDDVLLVVPTAAVTGRDKARYQIAMQDFLEQSNRRGLLLWRSRTSTPAVRRLVS